MFASSPFVFAIAASNLNDGNTTVLATRPAPVQGVSIDDQFVYAAVDGQVIRIPKRGGDPLVLAQGGPMGVAVDDHYVYWIDIPDGSSSSSIKRVPK